MPSHLEELLPKNRPHLHRTLRFCRLVMGLISGCSIKWCISWWTTVDSWWILWAFTRLRRLSSDPQPCTSLRPVEETTFLGEDGRYEAEHQLHPLPDQH